MKLNDCRALDQCFKLTVFYFYLRDITKQHIQVRHFEHEVSLLCCKSTILKLSQQGIETHSELMDLLRSQYNPKTLPKMFIEKKPTVNAFNKQNPQSSGQPVKTLFLTRFPRRLLFALPPLFACSGAGYTLREIIITERTQL